MIDLRAMTMPKWGIEMTEGTLSEWKVSVGERIAKGQIVAVIESEKIANEVEAEYDGIVARLVASEGDTCPVGELLAVLTSDTASEAAVDEFVRHFQPAEGSAAAALRSESQASSSVASANRAPSSEPTSARSPAVEAVEAPRATGFASIPSHIAISPAARALAEQHDIDVTRIQGSGRGGRITLQDVEQASRLKLNGSGDVQIVKMSSMRKTIARQLTHAKATIPHFYLRNTVRIDALLALRRHAQETSADAPSLNDYFVRAVALALIEVPDVNVQVHEDAIHRFKHADIAVAVATDKGLLTPIVREADTKPVNAIARETRALVERARAGKLRAEEIQGGSFTVSNLGMFGIDQFDAIINPPQGAILAIGAGRPLALLEDGKLVAGNVVNLSLSCDHRAIDGAVGAKLMDALRKRLEAPASLAG